MRFKELADKKQGIFDEDIHALVSETQNEVDEVYKLVTLEVTSKTGAKPEAKLTLTVNGQEKNVTATGSGPARSCRRGACG